MDTRMFRGVSISGLVILAIALVLIFVSPLFNTQTVSQIYIKVNGHAFKSHPAEDVNSAFECMSKNGTKLVMSEKGSRNLHWICVDPVSFILYDVITTFLTKTIERPSGQANLVTAYIPESTVGRTTLEWYVEHLMATKEAIIVNLRAFPGNIFFGP